jgi:trimeric autotransporter adhesin
MKTIPKFLKVALFLFPFTFFLVQAFAQAPEKFNYQAVCRDNAGAIIDSQNVSFLITIRDGSPSGTDVYHETHNVMTNAFGLVNFEVGGGTASVGNFSAINWSSGAKYLDVQMDIGAGMVAVGAPQLISVPYALYANQAGSSGPVGATGPTGPIGVTGPTGVGATGPTGPSGSLDAWSRTGNSGTVDGTNFIGTTDDIPFNIRVNNQKAGRIDRTYHNVFFGYLSGNSITTAGSDNTALGDSSLYTNASGDYNIAIGNGALKNNAGHNNCAVGFNALYKNINGPENTAIGTYALRENKNGWNTAVGSFALEYNTNGNDNAALGSNSLQYSQTGYGNTATGAYSMRYNIDGDYNTANGYFSLINNDSGSYNVAVGNRCMENNTTGDFNVAIGYRTMNTNTTKSHLVAVGDSALYYNGTGSPSATQAIENTAVGSNALFSNTVGYSNTAIGFHALRSNTLSYRNSATGAYALVNNTGWGNTADGFYALYSNVGGDGNTAIGRSAMETNNDGNYNTGMGYNCDVNTTNLIQTTVIGYNAIVNADYKVRLGGTTVTVVEGQVAYTFPSDGRFKYNVQEEVKGLDFIMKLRPVVYNFDTKKFDEFLMKNMSEEKRNERMKDQDYSLSSNIVHTGFIAQEVEQSAKECGFTFDGVSAPQDENGNYGVAYSQFTVPLVKAVQEQQAMILTLQKENANQKKINEDLQKQIDDLKKLINK